MDIKTLPTSLLVIGGAPQTKYNLINFGPHLTREKSSRPITSRAPLEYISLEDYLGHCESGSPVGNPC